MDPVAIVGILEGSISLAVQCGSVAKSLNCLAGQYKHAKLTISTMVQNLDIMQLAWHRIGTWSKDFMPKDDDAFTQRLEVFLETGSLVLDTLEADLQSYSASHMTFAQKSRLVWNESVFQGHQNRIRDQAQSMSLLLQAIQLPTAQAATKLLQKSKKQFTKSDKSAFSIVPSRLSSRLSLSTNQTSRHASIASYASMTYRRLTFEDDLFTARVYKRNYRNTRLQRLRKKIADVESEIAVPQDPDSDHETIIPQQSNEETMENDFDQDHFDMKEIRTVENHGGSSTRLALSPPPLLLTPTSASPATMLSTPDSSPTNFNLNKALPKTPDSSLGSASGSASTASLIRIGVEIEDDWVKRQLARLSGWSKSCPVHAAVFDGDVELMQSQIWFAKMDDSPSEAVEKVIGGTYDFWRPLHTATLKNNLRMVYLLLEQGAFVQSETTFGIQAIHLAAKIGSIEMIAALIDAGADPNCMDVYGRQPLHYLLGSRDEPDVIEYLTERGADIRGILCAEKYGQLHHACTRDYVGNLNVLVAAGQRIGSPFSSTELESALDKAILNGSALSVKYLLSRGASPYQCRSDGGTGLHTFVWRFYRTAYRNPYTEDKILRLLLDHVDLIADYHEGGTILDSLFLLGTKPYGLVVAELTSLFLKNIPGNKVLAKDELRSTMELYEGSNTEDDDSASDESVLGNTPQKTREFRVTDDIARSFCAPLIYELE